MVRIVSLVVALGMSLLPCLSYAQTYSKTETIAYSDNLTSWVLGQVQVTTTNGVEDARTDYDPTTALPVAIYSFGELLQSVTYNPDGTVATLTDGNNNVTRFSNYNLGIPQLIQFPATPDQPSGTSVTVVVDSLGQVRSVVDAAGAKTCYNYDSMRRLQQIQYPSETSLGQCGGSWNDTLMSFASGYPAADGLPAGMWRQQVTTGNLMTETLFDSLWRPVVKQTYDVTNPSATIVQTVIRYDANGNVSFNSYPQSTVNPSVTNTWENLAVAPSALGTSTLYDALNRVTSVTRDAEAGVGPLITTTNYLTGFRTQTTDPNQKVTTVSYMAFDEPTTDWPVLINAPEGVSQAITRDAYGKPLSITQSGLYGTESDSLTKTLVYDIYQRLCRTTEPESGDSSISYDGANHVRQTASGLTLTEAGCARDQVPSASATNYTYDPMNRLLTIQPPSGTQSTSYHYTPTGNVDQAVSGNSIWSAHFDYRDLLTDETLTLPGQDSWLIGYAFDGNGNLAQLTYPDGKSIAYAPDARGRPTQVGGYASQVGYYPNGVVSGFVYGNGAAYVAAQNTRQLLSNFSYGNGSTLNLSEDLSYDANGNILTVQDLVSGQRSKIFQYDGLNRLTSAVAPALWGTETYQYDALNNLRTRLTAGQTNVYNYNPANQLATITRGDSTIGNFGYDNLGNEASRNGTTLQFDQKNQLLQIPGVDSYQYDAAGRRTVKTPASGAGSTYTFYNHAGQLLYQVEPGQALSTDFIYLGTRMIARDASLHLAAPGAVTFDSNPNDGNYTVSWGAVPGATSYLLQEQANGGTWNTIPTSSGTSVTMSDKDGGSYVYQVRGCVGATCGDWTGSATLGVTPKLSVVSGPTDLVFGSYTVNWTAPVSASAYMVQESFNGGAWTTIVPSTQATSIVLTRPVGGTYQYQVSAYNAYGSRGWSAPITVNVTQVPETPTNLAVTTTGGVQTATWDAMPFATSYQVTSNAIPPGLGESMVTISGTTFTAAAGSAISAVQACSIAGCSGPAYNGYMYFEPSVPTVSGPTDLVFGAYTVSWTASDGATYYDVQEQVDGGAWNTIASATSATSISRPGTAGGTYQYQVSAWNSFGSKGWSEPVTVSVTQVPATPTNFTVTTSGVNTVLSWDAMAWATSYQLTVAGSDGNLGTYTYVVGTNSFNFPKGKYTAQYLTACSIAGCSAALALNNPFTVGGAGDTGATATQGRRLSADTSAPQASGCTARICAAVLGGNP